MRLSLIDEMLLLASTDEGRHALRDLPTLVAGAALADLGLRGRLDSPARVVTVIDTSPTGHPVLDDLLASVAALHRQRPAWRWAFDSARSLTRAEREHLVDVGVLGRQDDVVLGMLPRTRYPIADPEAQRQVVERVRDAVLGPQPIAHPGASHREEPNGQAHAPDDADLETRLLVSLLATAFHSRRTAQALFPELDARALRTKLRAASLPHWAVAGTAHAIRLANAAHT